MLLYIVPLPAVFSAANTAWPSYVAPRYSTSNATIYGTVAMVWKFWTWVYRTVAKTSVMHGWHWGQVALTAVHHAWVYKPVAKTSVIGCLDRFFEVTNAPVNCIKIDVRKQEMCLGQE